MGWDFLFKLFSLWEMSMNLNHLRKLQQNRVKFEAKQNSIIPRCLMCNSLVSANWQRVYSDEIVRSQTDRRVSWQARIFHQIVVVPPGFSMSNPSGCLCKNRLANCGGTVPSSSLLLNIKQIWSALVSRCGNICFILGYCYNIHNGTHITHSPTRSLI